MKEIIQKITDVLTIVFPAVIGIMGIFHLTNVIHTFETVEQCVFIALGALSAIASVIYNKVSKQIAAGK